MRRYFLLLALLALALTACSSASPEEQMYAAALDEFFLSWGSFQNIPHRVVYIEPTFRDASHQAILQSIMNTAANQAWRSGLRQVQTPDLEGLTIGISTIWSWQKPTIQVESSVHGLRCQTLCSLIHDSSGWHAKCIVGGCS